jgi:hypothetical protein
MALAVFFAALLVAPGSAFYLPGECKGLIAGRWGARRSCALLLGGGRCSSAELLVHLLAHHRCGAPRF